MDKTHTTKNGAAKKWALLSFLLLLIAGYIGFQFLAIPIRQYEIRKKADEKIRFEDNEVIRTKLVQFMKEKGVTISPDSIFIRRKGKGEIGDSVAIQFSYTDSCRLLGDVLDIPLNRYFVFHHDIELKNIMQDAPLRK
ncbi:hypothetical protein JXA84_07750 [candidate division WOR-3 bacterium]|nr:hypothetical protein [candidate division WOR-3 bacterium]